MNGWKAFSEFLIRTLRAASITSWDQVIEVQSDHDPAGGDPVYFAHVFVTVRDFQAISTARLLVSMEHTPRGWIPVHYVPAEVSYR